MVHVFPPCEFADNVLLNEAPDLYRKVQETAYLVCIIVTVWRPILRKFTRNHVHQVFKLFFVIIIFFVIWCAKFVSRLSLTKLTIYKKYGRT